MSSTALLVPEPASTLEAPPAFDWMHPDYRAVWVRRVKMLAALEADPYMLAAAIRHYRDDPDGVVDFINDWGVTVDPRNAGSGRPIIMPFILFPKQREFLLWLRARWAASSDAVGDGILVKSRDCGASWLAMAFSVWLCLFFDNVTVGFGSAKAEKVDKSGDPDCLFYKGRKFAQYLPPIFTGGWNLKHHSIHMQLTFPKTEASITGEAGDNIGVGGRKTIYFVDEAALVERPKLMDTSLSANTNCRIEMSSVRGIDNVFAERARGGKIDRFDFHYRYDPRKVNIGTEPVDAIWTNPDDKVTRTYTVQPGQLWPWFAYKKSKLDEIVFNQEYECDFLASIESGVIEHVWVQAAIGAAQKLGIVPTGIRRGAYDIADTGRDKNAVAIRHGCELLTADMWSGQNSNPTTSVRHAFDFIEPHKLDEMLYDGDGMGATWRDYFQLVATERKHKHPIPWGMFRGSGEVLDPEDIAPGTADRKNIDYFENYKAQCWMNLRRMFMETFRAVNGEKYDPSLIISINPQCANLVQLCSELCQPTRKWSKTGKLMIDKTPDDVMSPNLADAVMMAFCYAKPPMAWTDELLEHI
jgi:phage terminase large subunit